MRIIKLVIIGDSGVGKTSLRSNYVSGRFSTGYRATIGTDFITKTLPHHCKPEELVTLQIWDTAGQERFSSLSTAFFRGADAVLMMYDVNNVGTLQNLRNWWKEFQIRAPVLDEEASEYCCVVVGNKIDLAEETDEGRKMAVSEDDAQTLMEELIPTLPSPPLTIRGVDHGPQQAHESNACPEEVVRVPNGNGFIHLDEDGESFVVRPRPIDIRVHTNNQQPSVSRATSHSRLNGTVTTTRTGLSVYHTPSSSLMDDFVSAPSSPIHSYYPSTATSRTQYRSSSPASIRRKSTSFSTSSTSATIRPITPSPPTPPFDRGPKLFLASAKSGHAVASIFEYIARRVVAKWEWEERTHVPALDLAEHSNETSTVRLSQSEGSAGWTSTCCS